MSDPINLPEGTDWKILRVASGCSPREGATCWLDCKEHAKAVLRLWPDLTESTQLRWYTWVREWEAEGRPADRFELDGPRYDG